MNESYNFKGITFDFRNKSKYSEETNALKQAFTALIPYMQVYLKDKEIILGIKNKVELANYTVHFAITSPKSEGELEKYGSVSFDHKTNELIIVLHLIEANSVVIKFELMKTLIHEIFHLFIEGEEKVRRELEEFLSSFSIDERKAVLEKLLTPEEVNLLRNLKND